jgi:hypothetical protein
MLSPAIVMKKEKKLNFKTIRNDKKFTLCHCDKERDQGSLEKNRSQSLTYWFCKRRSR